MTVPDKDGVTANGTEVTPGDVTPFFGRLAPEAAQTADTPIGERDLGIHLGYCGAYIRDGFDGETLDEERWARMGGEKRVRIAVENGELVFQGTTDDDQSERRFIGVISRQYFPPGAVLVAGVQAASGLVEEGRLGYVVHLCGRMPDHNSEITFAQCEGKCGWFNWYLDQRGFIKWENCKDDPVPPSGDEETTLQTVAVEHNRETHESKAFLIREGQWLQVGRTQRMITHFSAPEIKIDTTLAGGEVDMRVDNVRMYPHPAHTPVSFAVLRRAHPGPAPGLFVAGVRIRLRLPDGREVSAVTDRTGQGQVHLPGDILYPISAEIIVSIPPDFEKSGRIDGRGLDGIYPGDSWVIDLD